jgi:membrane protease YdiL (CAAX protease family)
LGSHVPGAIPDQNLELESMTDTWVLSALWVGFALIATLLAIWISHVDGFVADRRRTVAHLIIAAAFALPLCAIPNRPKRRSTRASAGSGSRHSHTVEFKNCRNS